MRIWEFFVSHKIAVKICIFLVSLFILQTVISYAYINFVARNRLQADLKILTERIKNDLHYQNGHWDTTLYVADPDTPNPHGSSGFIDPLYILTIDGTVIERNMTIKGFLDASDYKQFLQYQTPQTISGITNEQWRVLAKPIVSEGVTHGVVIVSYYTPDSKNLDEIDQKLKNNIDFIISRVQPNSTDLNVSQVDVRRISYDVSFKVVTNLNKVKLSNGRTPSFIDPSYVEAELAHPGNRVVTDSVSHIPYLVDTLPLKDDNKNNIGVVVAAKSLESLNSMLQQYLKLSALTLVLLLFPLAYLTALFVNNELSNFSEYMKKRPLRIPQNIDFDRKNSNLILDDEILHIPHDSNQYYFLDALFSQPKKRWEQDEMLEHLGQVEDKNSWRTIYDTMLAVNKKVGFKISHYKDKTYQLNPQYVTHMRVTRES